MFIGGLGLDLDSAYLGFCLGLNHLSFGYFESLTRLVGIGYPGVGFLMGFTGAFGSDLSNFWLAFWKWLSGCLVGLYSFFNFAVV